MTTAPLRFADAYHLTSGAPGPSAVAGCRLDLGRRGVTVRDPGGAPLWSAPWSAVTGLTAVERTTLPDGRTGIVVVVRASQPASPQPASPEATDVHRVVVPADRPAAVEEQLASLARARGIEPEPGDAAPQLDTPAPALDRAPDGADRSLPIFVVGPAVVVAGAVVTVLLLAAGHVIHL